MGPIFFQIPAFVTLPLIVFFVFILEKSAQKIQIPSVVVLLFSGLILGLPFFKNLFSQNSIHLILRLGDIALILLMFLAGLETSTKELKHETGEAIAISLLGAFIPFISGVLIFLWLGFPLVTALMVGVAMSITAEATTAALLIELKKSKTKLGTLMMETGIIDDILGFILFLLISFFFAEGHLKENLLISGAILSFFIGVLTQHRLNHHPWLKNTKSALFYLFIPFFFVSMGLNFDFTTLFLDPKLLLIILGVAFLGKMGGTLLAKPFTSLSWKQLHLLGWAMNSRGAIELALALIAFRSSLLSIELYSGIVLMVLITTLSFPIVVRRMIKNNPGIMK